MDKHCPRFREPCREHGCAFYVQILGQNPQTGAPLPNDGWGCADAWKPVLLIEIAKEVRQLAAAVESGRNEARKDTAAVGAALVRVAEAVQGTVPMHRHGMHGQSVDVLPFERPRGLFARLRAALKGG